MRPSSRSQRAFDEAQQLFPGGVNEPLRSYQAVGGSPRFFVRGHGARLHDVDHRTVIDFVQGWGTHILGHTPGPVARALWVQSATLVTSGAPSPLETDLGRLVQDAFPSMERLRFVNSGTEAVMSAVRVARAATARPLVLKFDGGSHGHSDGMLVQAGSGLGSPGLPSSAGVDQRQASGTISIPYNNLAAVQGAFEAKPDKVAAVLVEPIATNMGLVLPRPGYLSGLRKLCDQHGALLLFDEVTTGFRLCWGGVQTLLGVTPDLTILGKILGGGLGIGAYGGRRDLMAQLNPLGPVYQAGTFSGNPLAMACGVAVLRTLRRRGFYERLEDRGGLWAEGLDRLFTSGRQTIHTQGSLFSIFFTPGPVHDFSAVASSDHGLYGRFFHSLLNRGVLLPTTPFEAGYLGIAHGRPAIRQALEAVEAALIDLHC